MNRNCRRMLLFLHIIVKACVLATEGGETDNDNDGEYVSDTTHSETASFTACGGEITSLPEDVLRTPQYPTQDNQGSTYPSNAYCEWWFDGDEKTLIRFKMWDLSVEIGAGGSNTTCDYDYVEIFVTSIGSKRFCGYNTPDGEVRGKGSFKVLFVSDGANNFRGLSGSYQIIEDFDPCEPSPCSHYGTCQVQPDLTSVICLCAPGFTGKHCDVDIQECQSNPCRNGGTCSDRKKPDHYWCDCVVGYEGYNCETKINHPCIPDPCQFGGTCHNHTETSYSCQCPQNRTGANCEEDNFPPCSSYPCQNGGECSDVEGEQKYVAVPPPLGSNEEPKNVPRSPEYFGFNCTCSDQYRGKLCELDAGCGDPGIPTLEDGHWFDANSIVKFSCLKGYILEGNIEVTCYHNGTWSSDIPRCSVNESEVVKKSSLSPWAISMISLSIAFIIDLSAFAIWMRLEKPWASADRVVDMADDLRPSDDESCYTASEVTSAYTSQSCTTVDSTRGTAAY